MADILILNDYNKFIKLSDNIDYSQPYFEKPNVIVCSDEIESFCKLHNISYLKLPVNDFKAMAGL